MNIIKGIDRIALVMAMITTIAVFVLAVLELKSDRTLNPEYRTWEKECDDRIKELEQKNPSIKLKNRDTDDYFFDPDAPKFRKRRKVLENDDILQNLRSRKPTQYKYLPAWMPYVYGSVVAFISFMIVLLGIRGATRGIKWFSLWIIDGFKDEKKSRTNP